MHINCVYGFQFVCKYVNGLIQQIIVTKNEDAYTETPPYSHNLCLYLQSVHCWYGPVIIF